MSNAHRDWFVAQLDAEAGRTRRALELVPEGKYEWTPHPRSMPFGRLAQMVSGMPGWIALVVNQDELDVHPPAGGSTMNQTPLKTAHELVQAHEASVTGARAALAATTDDHLAKPWKLLAGGKVMTANPRTDVLRDTFMHLAHHRGQLTVYLRLAGATVPAIYGPSADDTRFS
jgi:uncharacterized damage-inducible protein DinB